MNIELNKKNNIIQNFQSDIKKKGKLYNKIIILILIQNKIICIFKTNKKKQK